MSMSGGPLERSHFAGTVHRKCQVEGCKFINALDDDDEEVSDLGSFPKNDAGEPLMSGEAYRYEQYLNAEPDPGDPYDDYFDYDDEEQ